MITDSRLQHDVIDELEYDPSVDHTQIGVAVTAGVVTLTGFVYSYPEKLAVENAVRRVVGVRAIAEELVVRLPSESKWGDGEIARRIVDMFSLDGSIPKHGMEVKVEDGWVTLTGEVDWRFQSDAASGAAGLIHGVLGVTNLLAIKKQPTAGDVRDSILNAFKRSADVDASGIRVITDGGKITLLGKVKAWHEREMAERAAWAAPGVTQVEDNIVLSF